MEANAGHGRLAVVPFRFFASLGRTVRLGIHLKSVSIMQLMQFIPRSFGGPLAVLCSLGILLSGTGCGTSQSARSDVPAAAEEEVEVGYGTQSRDRITGAIDTVSGEEVRQRRTTDDLYDLLEGNVAGVVVNRTASGLQVRIRGTSSIYGSNEPLYVIDGTPVDPGPDGVLYAVNPYDVESITVLKDAAATSIYGSRGGNGVILITTRRGN